MYMKELVIAAFTASLTGFGTPQTALAQDAEDAGGANLVFEEVIVTATKREQSIYDVAMAVSAFSAETIVRQGITGLTDIGKFVPNMNVTEFSAGHTSSVNAFIRGIGLQDHLITTDPGVGVYVDGVYLGRQVGQNWSLSNLERIEVLRGPQGTLYGRNSIGGAINLITKTPGSEPGARLGLEVGSRGRLNGDFFGDTNLSDTIAVSFGGGFKNRDGIGTFVNLPNAGIEVGEMQEVYGRIAIKFEPNDDFSIIFTADANNGEGGLRPYTTLIDELPNGEVALAGYTNADVSADPYDNNTGQANQVRVTNEAEGFSITANWTLSDDLEVKIIAGTRSSEYKAGLDDDSFVDDFLSFPEVGEADQTSIELQLNGDFGSWDFVSGLYWFDEDGGNFQSPTIFLSFPGSFFLDQEVTSVAIFGNVGYNVSDQLRISGGLRYTEDDKDASTDVGSGLFTASRDFDELSWELAANYTLDNGLNVYGTIQNGYQSGQFPARPFCLFVDVTCFVASDNITATNFEVGIKGQPFERLQMSAAVFFTQYEDLPYQVSTTVGGGFSTVNLIVDQDSTGFEWESTAYLTDNFLFHATLGYIDVDVDPDPITGVKPVAPLTPELTFSISPEVRFPTAGGGEVTFRADYSFRDDMFGEPTSDPGRFTFIDSRDLLNVDISYRPPDGTWTAAIYGRNVTDERYDNARLNTGDYVLVILSNDASEFGVRFTKDF
ncbi:MAG: TonB-dependent receptor [Chloroflexi bacterium]|nr:TonB-dependent receptor [Chloroflexota bacterium]